MSEEPSVVRSSRLRGLHGVFWLASLTVLNACDEDCGSVTVTDDSACDVWEADTAQALVVEDEAEPIEIMSDVRYELELKQDGELATGDFVFTASESSDYKLVVTRSAHVVVEGEELTQGPPECFNAARYQFQTFSYEVPLSLSAPEASISLVIAPIRTESVPVECSDDSGGWDFDD